jgi:hypothetical protein
MVLYAYVCVFVHSRFVENLPIWSWETNSSFLSWYCHNNPAPPVALAGTAKNAVLCFVNLGTLKESFYVMLYEFRTKYSEFSMLYAGPKMFYVMLCEFRTKLCQPKCYLDHLSDYYVTSYCWNFLCWNILCCWNFVSWNSHIQISCYWIFIRGGYFCHFLMPVKREEVF